MPAGYEPLDVEDGHHQDHGQSHDHNHGQSHDHNHGDSHGHGHSDTVSHGGHGHSHGAHPVRFDENDPLFDEKKS